MKSHSLVIEITEAFVKIWHQDSQPGELSLAACDRLDRPEELASSLMTQLKNFDVAKSDIGVVLPRSCFVVRFLELPEGTKDELRQMITHQITQFLPYDLSEITFDFLAAPIEKSAGKSRIALYVVTRQATKVYLDALNQAGLQPAWLSPPTPFFLQAYGASLAAPDKVNLILDVEQGNAELCFLKGRHLLLSRHFVIGRTGDSDEWLDLVIGALNEMRETVALSEIHQVVTNDASILKPLAAHMATVSPHLRVTLLNKAVAFQQMMTVQTQMSRFPEASFTVGLGLRGSGASLTPALNLLPADLQKAGTQKRLFHSLRLTMILATIFLVSVMAYVMVGASVQRNEMRYLEKELGSLGSQTKEVRGMLKGLEAAGRANLSKRLPLVLLAEIFEKVPSGIFLSYYEFSVKEGLRIRGMAGQVSQVSDLLLILQKSEYVKEAEIKFAKKRMERGQEYTDFQINANLRDKGSADA